MNMLTRRLFLSHIPAAVAAVGVPGIAIASTESIKLNLEQMLERMTANERKFYHADQLALAMREITPGAWDVKFDTRPTGEDFVILMRRT